MGKAVNIRLDDNLHTAVTQIARDRNQSFNRVVQDALVAEARRAQDEKLREACEAIGRAGLDEEMGLEIKREVVFGE